MIDRITDRLDQVPERHARHMNMVFSSIGGLIYLYLLFNLSAYAAPVLTAAIIVAAMFDTSTVYFVHSGVLSQTLDRIFSQKQIDRFMKLHLWPSLIGYTALAAFVVSLYVNPVPALFYVFIAGWMVTYLSGTYTFLRLR